MSKIKFIFERQNLPPLNPFYNIGPPPFVSVSSENVYVNDVMHTVDRVTLSGRIKKDNCSDDFSQLYQKAKNLIDNFNRSFDKLSISEPTQPGDAEDIPYAPIYEWEYVIVRSVSFDENKWFDWVPYTIELDCYKNGYFASDGIINPSRTVSYETQNDNIVSLTISCSCNGINNSNQAIENARSFADLNSDVLLADITQSVSIHPNIKNVNYFNPSFPEKKILKSVNESIDRLAGTVSVQKTYLLQEEVGVSNGILRFTRSLNTSENGETTVSINGSIEGCIDRKNELGQGYSSDTTLDMIEDDIKNKDWYSIAKELYINNKKWQSVLEENNQFVTKAKTFPINNDSVLLWSTYDVETLNFVKNPLSLFKDYDTSGFIIGNSEAGWKSKKLGVMVTKRHYLYAWHFRPPVGTTVYLLDRDNNIVSKTIVSHTQVGTSDIGIAELNSDVPDSITIFKVLDPSYFNNAVETPIKDYALIINKWKIITDLLGSHLLIRDQMSGGVSIHKASIAQLTELNRFFTNGVQNFSFSLTQSVDSYLGQFYLSHENHDSGSSVFLPTDDGLVFLGSIGGLLGGGDPVSFYVDKINAITSIVGKTYVLTLTNDEKLFKSPTNFSIQRNPDQNSVNFSLEYSNKINNDITIVDTTTITNNYENSQKCIEVSLTISSSLKNHEARWDSVINYFNSFDMIEYVKRKWAEYGNEEELNLNVNNTSYSEDKFQGTIQVTASFCASKGEGCGCLQNMQYSYQFVPPLKEYKVGVAFGGQGCHYVEDIDCLKRASFTLAGRLIQSTCCSYEKTVMELKNKVNQISNYIFFGEDKILDSSEISSKKPNGEISFSFAWSAKKAEIIPENIQ